MNDTTTLELTTFLHESMRNAGRLVSTLEQYQRDGRINTGHLLACTTSLRDLRNNLLEFTTSVIDAEARRQETT